MKTLFFETLAQTRPGKLSLVHVYPGLVVTDGFEGDHHPFWFKAAWKLLRPLTRTAWISTPSGECGERILYLGTSARFPPAAVAARGIVGGGGSVGKGTVVAVGSDGVESSGVYTVDIKGETISLDGKGYGKLRNEGFAGKVWGHIMAAFGETEAGIVFLG